jgi:anthranilate synthase component II
VICLIDNYDSFTYNLRRYFRRLECEVTVVRNDSSRMDGVVEASRAVVISPGPKRPDDAGRCLQVVREISGHKPILGICLGHQIICQAFGARIVRAMRPMHGRTSEMHFKPSRIFEGIEDLTPFARYHSLVAEPNSLPSQLRVVAESGSGEVMAVEHVDHVTIGVQFHPESVLSTAGYRLLANFLRIAGLPSPDSLPEVDLKHQAAYPTVDWTLRTDQATEEAAVVLPNRCQ